MPFIRFYKSYGAHVISAMATEIKDSGLGQVDRLTLLDPGINVPMVGDQRGLIRKVIKDTF